MFTGERQLIGCVVLALAAGASLILGCSRGISPADGGPADSGARRSLTADGVRALFERELDRRGHASVRLDGGIYEVVLDGGRAGKVMKVYIGNLQLNAVRDDDPGSVKYFIDRMEPEALPPWEVASSFVYFELQPNDFKYRNELHSPLSPRVDRPLVLARPGRGTLEWVTGSMVSRWGVPLSAVEEAAGRNMDRLLETISLEVDILDAGRLGLIPLDSPLKASTILAPHFRSFVEPRLGWPVQAVTPCRDFVYVFPAGAEDLVNRSGGVVLDEYAHSGYPLTTEVWEISDAGLHATGAFGPSHP